MAEHYGAVVIPARPSKPRDKAKVKAGVQLVERWIIARLRHQHFTEPLPVKETRMLHLTTVE